MTDSTAAGYLAPESAPPLDDAALDKAIARAVAGITGLAADLVTIKGQPIPAQQPSRASTWCAVGVTGIEGAVYTDDEHFGSMDDGQGASRLSRPEEIEVMASFYGPGCRAVSTLLRDGFAVAQNRDALRSDGFAYVRTERVTGLADLENQQFVRRADVVIRLRRIVARVYPIRNVARLAGFVAADGGDATSPAPIVADI